MSNTKPFSPSVPPPAHVQVIFDKISTLMTALPEDVIDSPLLPIALGQGLSKEDLDGLIAHQNNVGKHITDGQMLQALRASGCAPAWLL